MIGGGKKIENPMKMAKKCLKRGGEVTLKLENSGVYVDDQKYLLCSHLTITTSDGTMYTAGEFVDNRGPEWYSNYTGAKVEQTYFDLVDSLTEYIVDSLVKTLKRRGIKEGDIDYTDDAVYYFKDGKQHELVFMKRSEEHNVGRHVYITILRKPTIR